MRGDGWNRLTNGQRDELVKLPVWTTEEDRRRALSYADRDLAEAEEAISAVRAGRRAPANLGEIVAVARYEAAGWMPDGTFERWRRWEPRAPRGVEQKTVEQLVAWLAAEEQLMQSKQLLRENELSADSRRCEELVAAAQDAADQARRRLAAHQLALVRARLAVSDVDGARDVAWRMPAGGARDEVEAVIYKAACPA